MKFPIRIRLAIASCSVFLVVIAALEVVAYVSVRAAIYSIVDHELETRLAGLDDHLARHIKLYPWPQLSESLKLHPAFQPDLLRIESRDGKVLLEGVSVRGARFSQASVKTTLETVQGSGHMLRVLIVRRLIAGQIYNLALATNLVFSAAILGRLWLLMLLSVPLVLLISGGAGYWISGKALAPVTGIIAAARSMDTTRLSERLAVPGTGDEIQQLAETMNGMLARIEAGFERVRQFTANASHELRTPLAIIRANAEVALLHDSNGGRRYSRDALRRILKEAEKDSALLENMLQLARADAETVTGLDRSAFKMVNLFASVRLACTDMQPVAEGCGLTLRIVPSGSVCEINGDEEQLRRLWFILIDNAVKYTPEGGVISAFTGMAADGRPFCAISDTGIGIAPEHQDRVFERFYRVDKARSRSRGGSGLGLAIAQHIAAAHNAIIELESEAGKGSRFTVSFPAMAAARECRLFTERNTILR